MSTKSAVFSLYRALTREAKKLSDYNFRSHAVRRVRKGFEMNREISGGAIDKALVDGKQDLEMLKRQATIGQMYPAAMSVME